jgi:hypothetical protein
MWAQLEGNYGPGTVTAHLLSEARSGAPLDQWYDDLFQNLLHQYTLSQVAYAATPHLVEMARERPQQKIHLLVLLGACYAHAADPDSPPAPASLQPAWDSARQAALPLILETLEDPDLDEPVTRYLLSSLAALKGHNNLAQAIETQENEIQCPYCGEWIERF